MNATTRLALLLGLLVALASCGGDIHAANPDGGWWSGHDGAAPHDRGQQDVGWLDPDVDNDGDGYTIHQGDCDDTNPNVHPGAKEICGDGIDNDCNGFIDEQEPDKDGDGFGPCQGDCDDNDPNVHPGAKEIAGNGKDDNCDGITDDDLDGDGYLGCGNPGAPPPPDCDCDDNDPDVHPGAVEICGNGKDDDCNGYTDDQEPDKDGDGYGPCSGDCDDTNPNVHPGAAEIEGNGIDDNCDGLVDEDIDGDGWTVANGDCDDHNPNVNPGVLEICGNGIDDNCNGVTDTDCLSPCDMAAITRSNVGCEYYAVDMDNENSAATACYAIIVSNPDTTRTANVRIQHFVSGAAQDLNFPSLGTTRAVAPMGLQIFRVSGACSSPGAPIAGDAGLDGTGVQSRGAFRIVSDNPVVAYQINPFEAASIHTTDASLLIPTAALDKHYFVISYPQTNPSRGSWDLRGSMNVLATRDNTQVTITSSTYTRAGGSVPALSPGQTWSTILQQFDNLQIETLTTGHDLSGTYVLASAPVAVFGGNECADVPINYGYCDHVEEQMTPLSTWGTEYVAARHPKRANENALWRLVAAVDGTTINFNPSVHTPYALNRGQVVEFPAMIDFVASSTDPLKPFFLVQIMQGAEKTAQESGTDIYTLGNLRGDPAECLSVPTAQYLDRYVVMADPTYAYNWLVIVRSDPSDTIHVDCLDPIPNAKFTTIGSGPYQVAIIRITAESGGVDGTCTAGTRALWGDGPFGVWVWGVYADTSYGYPGGMNLQQIYPVN